MTRLFSLFLLCLFSLILTSPLFAWNALGHMVIASIAYQQIQADSATDHHKKPVAAQIDNMVAQFSKEYPEFTSYTQLAYWPDTLRSQKIEMFTHWHYIDHAISLDGTPIKKLEDEDNAVWAIGLIKNIVENDHANIYERARFLAFLTHIVGDLHQPLHTSTLISMKNPDGDRGGNLYPVRINQKMSNLHALWDSGLGTFGNDSNVRQAETIAASIMKKYPKKSFGTKAEQLDPEVWAKEGLENAKMYVYSNAFESMDLSPDYIETGKRISEEQAALAGYRLAAILESSMK